MHVYISLSLYMYIYIYAYICSVQATSKTPATRSSASFENSMLGAKVHTAHANVAAPPSLSAGQSVESTPKASSLWAQASKGALHIDLQLVVKRNLEKSQNISQHQHGAAQVCIQL